MNSRKTERETQETAQEHFSRNLQRTKDALAAGEVKGEASLAGVRGSEEFQLSPDSRLLTPSGACTPSPPPESCSPRPPRSLWGSDPEETPPTGVPPTPCGAGSGDLPLERPAALTPATGVLLMLSMPPTILGRKEEPGLVLVLVLALLLSMVPPAVPVEVGVVSVGVRKDAAVASSCGGGVGVPGGGFVAGAVIESPIILHAKAREGIGGGMEAEESFHLRASCGRRT